MTKRIKRLLSIIILLIFVCSAFVSCGTKQAVVHTVTSGIYPDRSSVPAYRYGNPDDYKLLISDSGCAFYLDKKTGSFAVRNETAIWSALPFASNSTAAVFIAKVFNGKEYSVLDSQRNCASFKTFEYSCEGNTVKAIYTLAANEATAKKSPEEVAAGDIYLRIPVYYIFENNTLKIRIDMSECFSAEDLVTESISFLPYFGAVANGKVTDSAGYDDYFLVPDGCGAIIYTGNTPADYNEKTFSVYGSTDENSHYAPFGAFGIKRGKSAFAAAVTSGEALAEIKTANASAKTSQMNIVYPEFRITETARDGAKLYYTEGYKGIIEVDYRFLGERNADYIGMASAVRAMFIYSGKLADSIDKSNGYTVNIEIDGSTDGTKKRLLSRFEDIEDLLSVIKAKNINNANIIINGFLPGGLLQNEISSLKFIKAAGTERDFRALCNYAKKQGYNIYPASDMMYFSGSVKQASDVAGDNFAANTDLTAVSGEKVSGTLKLTEMSGLEKKCIRLMKLHKKIDIAGFALNDTDKPFVADINSGVSDKQTAADIIGDNISSFGALDKLIINGCGFNAIRGADVAVNVPYYTSFEENQYYKAVPFAQAVIHSSVVYSGAPANTASLPRIELLKTVEYGGVPFFRWNNNNNSMCYYENMFNEAVEFCTAASEKLADLPSKRITAHREVESGVYCTEFGSETLIYVNYNNYSVNIGEIAVMPYDYIRIN